MNITRRNLLAVSVAFPLIATGCTLNPATVVALTQEIFTYLTSVITGGEALLAAVGVSIPDSIQTQVNADLTNAEDLIVNLDKSVGSNINITTAKQAFDLLSDLVNALSNVPVVSSNPIFFEIQMVVTVIGVAWSIIAPAVTPSPVQINAAVAHLQILPIPVKLATLRHFNLKH